MSRAAVVRRWSVAGRPFDGYPDEAPKEREGYEVVKVDIHCRGKAGAGGGMWGRGRWETVEAIRGSSYLTRTHNYDHDELHNFPGEEGRLPSYE